MDHLLARLQEIRKGLDDGRLPKPFDLHRAVAKEEGGGWNFEAVNLGIGTLDEIIEALSAFEGSQPGHSRDEAFIADWNKMVVNIGYFAAKYNMKAPQMVFHPQWRMHMARISTEPLAPVIIYEGVKIRFGYFEQVDALRPA
jgi:hypothetical protein